MPFQATRRHQYWTVDVRYLDMHQLGGGMIYVISILENFSRAILASAVSRTQDVFVADYNYMVSRTTPDPAS